MIALLFAAGFATQNVDGGTVGLAKATCPAEVAFPAQRSSDSSSENAVIAIRQEDGLTIATIGVREPPPTWRDQEFVLQLASGDRLRVPKSAISAWGKKGLQVHWQLPGRWGSVSIQGGTLMIGDVQVPIKLRLASGGSQNDILRRCGEDFIRQLGIDPAALVDVSFADVIKLFSVSDYPPAARRAGVEGRVLIVFSIASDGSVNSCKVAVSSGFDLLDARTCEVVSERGHFARAPAGTPPRWTSASIRWGLTSRN
ncbi:MAG: energy transducer TonB [Sphingomonas sp.]|uniref:energy transducer TonB n=1 Tax=Sphingomonas sp. TaxID=28214 RepID=UPI003F80304C